MDFSGLLRRLLTDSHRFHLVQGWFLMQMDFSAIGWTDSSRPSCWPSVAPAGTVLQLSLSPPRVVAGAIAETDDSLWGRVKNLAMTLLCFLFASLCVQYLFPTPGSLPSGSRAPPLSSSWWVPSANATPPSALVPC